MNVQSFYEHVILRDILAYTLPGAVVLLGVAMVAQAYGYDDLSNLIPPLFGGTLVIPAVFLTFAAFLLGHLLDMAYRKLFRNRDWYRQPDTVRRWLIGTARSEDEADSYPVAAEIRKAVGQFLTVDWTKESVEEWIASGRAAEANAILRYWIEQDDAKLYNAEVGLPAVQAHFLHASGLALAFFGACTLLAGVVRSFVIPQGDPRQLVTSLVLAAATSLIGFALIWQGGHKRGTLISHMYCAFYVLWRRRMLDYEHAKPASQE